VALAFLKIFNNKFMEIHVFMLALAVTFENLIFGNKAVIVVHN